MLQRHILLTAALLATLGLTACGKNKNGGNPPPQTQSQPQAGGETGTDLPQLEGAGKVDPTVAGQTQAQNAPVAPEYQSSNAQNVDSNEYGKRLTGAVSADGLLYTSTATDDTLDVLRGLKRDNMGLAASVSWAQLRFDSITDESVVTLKVQENGFPKTYNLIGSSAAEDNQTIKLRAARFGNGEKTTGSLPISGSLRCLDLDGGCEVTLVKVKLGYSGSSNLINIVFRQSVADLFFKLPKLSSGNPEYDYLEEMAQNTYKKVYDAGNRVKTSRMYSWEVANGRSGFSVVLKTNSDQLLAYSGPLLSPDAGNATDIALTPLKRDPNGDADDVVKLNFQNTIGQARLIANNGLGQLRIAFKMRKRGMYKQDVFSITFMRRLKPVVDLKASSGDESNNDNGGYGPGEDLPTVE